MIRGDIWLEGESNERRVPSLVAWIQHATAYMSDGAEDYRFRGRAQGVGQQDESTASNLLFRQRMGSISKRVPRLSRDTGTNKSMYETGYELLSSMRPSRLPEKVGHTRTNTPFASQFDM